MSGAKRIHRVSLHVVEVNVLSPTIREYVLRDEDGWPLPPFTAGAHIDVHVPDAGVRQYSLAGDPARNDEWRIAVLREEAGRGGSRRLHETLKVGDEVLCSLPRNVFPFPNKAPVTMIAGGIGITPFLSALPVLRRGGQNTEIHYAVRTRSDAVFIDRLPDAHLHISAEHGRASLEDIVTRLPADTHLFVCGPTRMIEDAQALGAHLGERLHVEHFGSQVGADPAYSIELARQGRVIPVAAGQSMLNALRDADVDIPASCEGGICLECKTRWLSGAPIHRELTMPKTERSQWITPCVSGCASEKITLDL